MKQSKSLLALSFLVSIPLNLYAQNYFVELKTKNPSLLRQSLEARGIEVEGYSKSKGLLGIVTDDLTTLSKIENEFSNDPLNRFQSVQVTESKPFLAFQAADATDGVEEYLGTEQVVEELQKLESEFPQYAKVLNVTEFLNVPQTHEGRDIFALVVGNHPSEFQDKPKLLMIGEHHAREVTTPHAVIDGARDLLTKARNREEWAANAIENTQIVFLPAVNPDGLNTVMTQDRMWRKNRSPNGGGAKGVDLNRNYGFKWGKCGQNESKISSDVYKGPAADSEPEVQLAEALNQRLHFQYAISYHSYGNEVLMPYLCATLAEKEVYNSMRDKIQKATGFGKRPASSSGEDHEWHYNKLGTLAFLLEIGDDFQPSFKNYREKIWPKVQKVVPLILGEMSSNFTEIHVKNRQGKPVLAEVSADAVAFKEGEVRMTDNFGTLRWRLPNGNHNLKIKVGSVVKKTITTKSSGNFESIEVILDE